MLEEQNVLALGMCFPFAAKKAEMCRILNNALSEDSDSEITITCPTKRRRGDLTSHSVTSSFAFPRTISKSTHHTLQVQVEDLDATPTTMPQTKSFLESEISPITL